MTRIVKVPMFQTARPVTIDADATEGAVVGVNLRWPDGSLVDLDALGAGDPGDGQVAYWRFLLEIPPNVTALAEQTGAGIYVITGPGSSAAREIELATGELEGSNLDGVAGNPSIGLSDVPDGGGGVLQKTSFDSKGRKDGTSEATTDDLPEGGNRYFTDARAREAVVDDFLSETDTEKAPSHRAVYEALNDISLTPGPAGKDGQIRYTGVGPPGTIVGANPGDTYMDLSTGDVYKLE